MLFKVKNVMGFKLNCLDGEIGEVKEFYFDDHHWTVRYLVANTGNWLTGRQVLISPHALLAVNEEEGHITVNLNRQQIEESPPLNKDQPVSRQYESSYFGYYGWPMYWQGPFVWGAYPYIMRTGNDMTDAEAAAPPQVSNLRSTHDVDGYHIEATDGDIGHVDDFVIDDETWMIRYLVVDTRNWWPGKRVLIAPNWIYRMSWVEAKVVVDLSCDAIKASPEYSDDASLSRTYEAALHRHYDRRGYWVNDASSDKVAE